jgi:glycosyltransferase involved in cell wall biosynthesis
VTDVLWLFEYPTLHGGEHSLLATLPALRSAGFRITAAGPGAGPLADELASLDVPLDPIAWRGADGARRPLFELRGELAAMLRDRRPDLLHANSLSMGRLSGPVADDLQLPSIAHLRDIIGLSAAAVADLARNARLLAVSHATRDFHVGQGLPGDRVQVLYNGVDLEKFRPRPADGRLHAELGLPRDALLIGTIGQIVLRKGLDVLAAAAARLADELPAAHFVVIGGRHSHKDEAIRHEQAVRQAFMAAGLGDRARFLGERSDVAELLPEFAILAHPARQEPLGRVLLEAAACGVAVVATEVGGTGEIFPEVEEETTEEKNVQRPTFNVQRSMGEETRKEERNGETSNIEHRTSNVEQGMADSMVPLVSHSSSLDVECWTLDVERSSESTSRDPSSHAPPSFDVQRSTFDVRRSSESTSRDPSANAPPSFDVRCSTFDVRPAPPSSFRLAIRSLWRTPSSCWWIIRSLGPPWAAAPASGHRPPSTFASPPPA